MKRQRTDTAKGALNTMRGALTKIEPPKHCHMPELAMPFWEEIVSTRANDSWTKPDLSNAANLARTKADIERISKQVEEEGDIVINARGTQIVNPKHTLLETLSRRVVQLSRMLHVHAEATQGKSRDQVKQSKAQADAQNAMQQLEDDLIPSRH